MDIQIELMSYEHLNLINLENFDDFWTINVLKQELLNLSSFYIIAKYGNDIIGFAGLNFLLDEAHITNIVVRNDKRNLRNSVLNY